LKKTRTQKGLSLKTAVTCAVLVIVILIGSLMTVFSYIVKRNMIVTGYGEQVTRLAQTVASAIDPDLFAQTAEAGAPAGEYWFDVKDLLDRIINETGVMFIYTVLYGGNDEITYFATGDVYGNDEWAVEFLHLDTDIEWYPQELFEAMYTGAVTQSDIYDADEFGILIGGFAPIIDSSGNVVGLACVEINVDDVIATINASVFAMAIFALIVVVVFFVLAMIVANKGLIRPVNEITEEMSKVSDGDFNFQFPKSSIREISTLSESFGTMVQTLSTVIEEIQKRNQDIIEGHLSNDRKSIIAKGDYQKILDGVDAIADNMAIHMDELAKRLHTISEGIRYASKIQSDLLPKNQAFDEAFSDYPIIWKPRDVVGGDIFWLKNFEGKGTILCVCDCTGHGAPGAMLTMLLVSAFEDIVNENNCYDTAGVIYHLEQRLVSGFGVEAAAKGEAGANIQDGCDLAVLFIKSGGDINLSSANIPVFICNGKEVKHIKGQRLFIGEGLLGSKDEVDTIHIPADPDAKYYIASDGLFDQPGDIPIPFGYKKFKKVIMENHDKSQDVISDKVWEEFEAYRGAEPRVDDFELISFKP